MKKMEYNPLSEIDKKDYNHKSGIIFIIVNIVLKFVIYGYNTIWLNYMPPLPKGMPSAESSIFEKSIQKMIPFIIIDIFVIAIYVFKMYNKKIYNKKTDIFFPLVVLVSTLVLLYFLIRMQYSICV